MNHLFQAKVVNSSCSDGNDRSDWCRGGLWCQKSWNNQNGARFQINLDIQLSFFPAVSWGCAEEPPTEDYENCITEERWKSIFKINFKMFIIASFTSCLGICSLAMPIQYNLCNLSGTATAPKLCATATPTCAIQLNHLIFLFFL